MCPTEIMRYRESLQGMLNELASERRQNVADLSHNLADPADQAAQESDLNVSLLMQERSRLVAGEVRDALRRIEEGTYGWCEECGEDIDPRRLAAVPAARYCRDCQELLARPGANRLNA